MPRGVLFGDRLDRVCDCRRKRRKDFRGSGRCTFLLRTPSTALALRFEDRPDGSVLSVTPSDGAMIYVNCARHKWLHARDDAWNCPGARRTDIGDQRPSGSCIGTTARSPSRTRRPERRVALEAFGADQCAGLRPALLIQRRRPMNPSVVCLGAGTVRGPCTVEIEHSGEIASCSCRDRGRLRDRPGDEVVRAEMRRPMRLSAVKLWCAVSPSSRARAPPSASGRAGPEISNLPVSMTSALRTGGAYERPDTKRRQPSTRRASRNRAPCSVRVSIRRISKNLTRQTSAPFGKNGTN